MPNENRDTEKKENRENENEETSKKLPVWLTWTLVVLVVIISLAGAFSLTKFILLPKYRAYRITKHIAGAGDNKTMGYVHVIGDLTVNTLRSNGRRFVVAEYAIESKNKKIMKEVKTREPQLRDEIIKYLRNYTADQILSRSFQEDSKIELMDIVNSKLRNGKIDSLYYIKLIVQ